MFLVNRLLSKKHYFKEAESNFELSSTSANIFNKKI